MPRAIILVLDSFGCGGAEDAAAFGDAGADTLGHIAEACLAGGGDRAGLRQGPLRLPALEALGLGLAGEASTGRLPAGLARPAAPRGQWGYGVEISRGKDTPSGHWEIAGTPLEFAFGISPIREPAFPPALTQALVTRRRAARHPRRQACRGHCAHRRARRRTYAQRQADLLHIGRFGVPDRRARGDVRARTPL